MKLLKPSNDTKICWVKCELCGKYYHRITTTHLRRKHNIQSVEEYKSLTGGEVRPKHQIEHRCVRCGKKFELQKRSKKSMCSKCQREEYNARRREKRMLETPESEQKRKARFYGSISEKEKLMLGCDFDSQDGIDRNHATWDFVPGKRGDKYNRGKGAVGFCEIGSVTEEDLAVVESNGHQRIKAAIELENYKRRKNGYDTRNIDS